MAIYKLIYDPVTYEIVYFLSEKPTNEQANVAPVPVGFIWDEHTYWKYNPSTQVVEMKTGQELADAQAEKTLKDGQPARRTKWKNNAKSIIGAIKDGTATQAQIRRGVKLALFRIFEMDDEDDE